ncbi:unnamed protein product [Symbiodinium sp. CCMP2592]|nr:unnamed protein product [Symbiodinium sp. CCMP2592]
MVAVGDKVVVKATGASGAVSQSNGHASKVCGLWYLNDELQAASQPMKCGGGAPSYPGGAAGGAGMMVGGWSGGRPLKDADKEVWAQLCKTREAELGALGMPSSVSEQVVAGIKYSFMFDSGAKVIALSVPWMNKLEVLEFQKS